MKLNIVHGGSHWEQADLTSGVMSDTIAGSRRAIRAAWQDVCLQYDGLPPKHEELFKPFKRVIQYDNERLKADLVPQYRAMRALVTERYHLAAAETRAFYKEFLNFVESWNRFLAESIPPLVLAKLGHSEEKVMAFYAHIDAKMQQWQDDITRGK